MTDVETRPRSIAGCWQHRACLVLVLNTSISSAMALSYDCASPNVLQSFTNDAPAGTATGSIQSFAVPAKVVTIDAAGAQGGLGIQPGGLGAEVVAAVAIELGQTLCIVVGGEGGPHWSAGGGASFVYAIASGSCSSNLAGIGTGSLAPNLLVAAAGGGGSGEITPGNPGNAPIGAGAVGASAGGDGNEARAGHGGTNGNGGESGNGVGGGGGLDTDGGASSGLPGGQALVNGASGGFTTSYASGGFGGGGAGAGPGGGGGGYSGGGGGGLGLAYWGGGGGGGSFSATTPLLPYTQSGAQAGNGAVNLCFKATTPVTLQEFRVD